MAKLPLIIALAALVLALGMFVYVTDAPAYMDNDPKTCANCHVMDAVYENWYHAGHQEWAKCSECHLPHENLLVYYYIKGKSGMHDVYVFSTGQTPDMIRANAETKEIIQLNCIRCHENTVESMLVGAQPFERQCWDCHRNVAHGPRGISVNPRQDSVIYP